MRQLIWLDDAFLISVRHDYFTTDAYSIYSKHGLRRFHYCVQAEAMANLVCFERVAFHQTFDEAGD
jgi:hypothetical protein